MKNTIINLGNRVVNNYPGSPGGAILKRAPARLYPGHGKPFRTSDLNKYLSSLDSVRLYPLKPRR